MVIIDDRDNYIEIECEHCNGEGSYNDSLGNDFINKPCLYCGGTGILMRILKKRK